MIFLIKNEVIDLADRFDDIQDTLNRQQHLLEALVSNQIPSRSISRVSYPRQRRQTRQHSVVSEGTEREVTGMSEDFMHDQEFTVEAEELKRSEIEKRVNKGNKARELKGEEQAPLSNSHLSSEEASLAQKHAENLSVKMSFRHSPFY